MVSLDHGPVWVAWLNQGKLGVCQPGEQTGFVQRARVSLRQWLRRVHRWKSQASRALTSSPPGSVFAVPEAAVSTIESARMADWRRERFFVKERVFCHLVQPFDK